MKNLTFFVVLVFVFLSTVSMFSEEAGKIHIVKPGDTLWDLSAFYLQNPFLWPSIYQANKVNISNPHWIYPEQRFLIPPLYKTMHKVYIRPIAKKEAKENVSKVEAVTAALPIVARNLAYMGAYITDEKIENGYIVESEPNKKEHLISANTIYIDLGEVDGVQVGDLYTIFRMGKGIKSPVNGQNYGKLVIVLGKLVVNKVDENSSQCEIVQSFDIIKNHDMIMPYTPIEIPYDTELMTPESPVEGHLIAALKTNRVMQPFDIVYIDLGETQGISSGDYFEIIRKGKNVSDPGPKGKVKLPENKVGGLQVLTTRTETATCYITEICGKMDLKPGELIRLKGVTAETIEKQGTSEKNKESIEEIEEEEVVVPE